MKMLIYESAGCFVIAQPSSIMQSSKKHEAQASDQGPGFSWI